jgi:hypothetical protein
MHAAHDTSFWTFSMPGDATHLRIHSLTHDGSLADHNPDVSERLLGPNEVCSVARMGSGEVQPACVFSTVISWRPDSVKSQSLGRARCRWLHAMQRPSFVYCQVTYLSTIIAQSCCNTVAHTNMPSASMHFRLNRAPLTTQSFQHIVAAPQRRRCHVVR